MKANEDVVMEVCGRIASGEYSACVIGITTVDGKASFLHMGNAFECAGMAEALGVYMSNVMEDIGTSGFVDDSEDDE